MTHFPAKNMQPIDPDRLEQQLSFSSLTGVQSNHLAHEQLKWTIVLDTIDVLSKI